MSRQTAYLVLVSVLVVGVVVAHSVWADSSAMDSVATHTLAEVFWGTSVVGEVAGPGVTSLRQDLGFDTSCGIGPHIEPNGFV